jgi:cytoskeletal protein CcmA (bactofilin family)
MFNKKRNNVATDTLIGAGTQIIGDVIFSGGLRIDGQVKGNIAAASDAASAVVLSEKGHIEGTIRAARVVLNGEVVGPVSAIDYLELLPKARVVGDVGYKTIEIHIGAIVTGKLTHEPSKDLKVVELKPNVQN